MDRIAKKIMKYRAKELKGVDAKERITANTLMRVLIDVFLEKEPILNMQVLVDEDAVKE